MVLSDGEIAEAIEKEGLVISPPEGYDVLVKSASVDMRLAPIIQVIRPEMVNQAEVINPTTMPDVQSKIASCAEERQLYPDQPFVLEPGVFLIGSTAEKVALPTSLAGRIDGKSSLARFGVQVHLTAPKIDPGWPLNNITLEIINLACFRVALYPMMEIAALVIERLGRPSTQAYRGRFSSG
jgi:dCTP deaminase